MKLAGDLIKTGLVISSHFTQHSNTMNKTVKTPAKIGFAPALIALIIGAVAMGVSPVFVREAEIGPFASAFWRVAIALPVLAIWAGWELKKSGRKLRLNLSMAAVLAGVFFTGDLTFWHLSIVNTTMANATLLSCLAPAWVLIFSRAFIGEEVSFNAFIGMAVCLVGAALLIGTSFQLNPERLWGDIYGVITSFFFGLYFLAVRVARRTMGGGELIFNSTLVTAILMLIIATISGNGFVPATTAGYTALLALGLLSHAGGQGLLALAIGSLSAVFSSLVIFIEAIAAAFFGWLIFSEALTTGQLLGGGLILAGIWLARPRKAKTK